MYGNPPLFNGKIGGRKNAGKMKNGNNEGKMVKPGKNAAFLY
jgi:hypothetical protein